MKGSCLQRQKVGGCLNFGSWGLIFTRYFCLCTETPKTRDPTTFSSDQEDDGEEDVVSRPYPTLGPVVSNTPVRLKKVSVLKDLH